MVKSSVFYRTSAIATIAITSEVASNLESSELRVVVYAVAGLAIATAWQSLRVRDYKTRLNRIRTKYNVLMEDNDTLAGKEVSKLKRENTRLRNQIAGQARELANYRRLMKG